MSQSCNVGYFEVVLRQFWLTVLKKNLSDPVYLFQILVFISLLSLVSRGPYLLRLDNIHRAQSTFVSIGNA